MKLRIVEINGKKTAKQNETKKKQQKEKTGIKKSNNKKKTNKQTQNAGISERLTKVTPTLFIQL